MDPRWMFLAYPIVGAAVGSVLAILIYVVFGIFGYLIRAFIAAGGNPHLIVMIAVLGAIGALIGVGYAFDKYKIISRRVY